MTINDLSTEQPKEPTPELENNSGQGPNTEVPDIVAKRFNWGAVYPAGCAQAHRF